MLKKWELSFLLLPLLLAKTVVGVYTWLLAASFGIFLIRLDMSIYLAMKNETRSLSEGKQNKIVDQVKKRGIVHDKETSSAPVEPAAEREIDNNGHAKNRDLSDLQLPQESKQTPATDDKEAVAQTKDIANRIVKKAAPTPYCLQDILDVPISPEFTSKYSKAAKHYKIAAATANDGNIVNREPFLAAFDAATARATMEARNFIANLTKPSKQFPAPFLANFEASTAYALLKSAHYMEKMKEATTAHSLSQTTNFVERQLSKPTVALTTAENVTDKLPRQPIVIKDTILSRYEAASALSLFEAKEYIDKLPKVLHAQTITPREPFLASYELSTAWSLSAAKNYISNLAPVSDTQEKEHLVPEYLLTTTNTTDSSALAEFEATTAKQLSIAASEPAPTVTPREPFLASYELSTAWSLSAARSYISNLAPVSDTQEKEHLVPEYLTNSMESSALAKFEATTAKQLSIAASEPAPTVTSREPFLASYELSTAWSLSAARSYISNLAPISEDSNTQEKEHLVPEYLTNSMESSALADFEATTAKQLSIATSELEMAIPCASTSTSTDVSSGRSTIVDDSPTSTPTTSTPQHSLYQEQGGINEDKKNAADARSLYVLDDVSSTDETGQHNTINSNESTVNTPYPATNDKTLDMPWKDIYSSSATMKHVQSEPAFIKETTYKEPISPVFDVKCIYYPNCTNRNCKFVHPGPDNKPTLKRSSSLSKKQLSRAELIEKQARTQYPKWKSRCIHWPFCTNNHCKYAHPIKDCRMGDNCTFRDRCMFLHPFDFIEPPKKYGDKRHTLPEQQMKRF